MRGFLARGLINLGRALVSYGYGALPGGGPPPVIVTGIVVLEGALTGPTVLETSLTTPTVLEGSLVGS